MFDSNLTWQPYIEYICGKISKEWGTLTFALYRINTQPIFEFLEFIDFPQILLFETGKFVFKSRNNLLPINNIATYFERGHINHHHNLRNSRFCILVPLILLSSFKRNSVRIRGLHIWNDIPDSLKSSDSFNIFKKDFKLLVFQKEIT